MIRVIFTLAALLIAAPGLVKAESLSVGGIDLGRMGRASLPANIELMASATDGAAVEGFIVARFQNNQPVMKSADGTWRAWDGDIATLEFVSITAFDDVLRFPIGAWPTADALAPCTFTIGYRSVDGLKFGYFTVDGR